jgi:hypothetical protein
LPGRTRPRLTVQTVRRRAALYYNVPCRPCVAEQCHCNDRPRLTAQRRTLPAMPDRAPLGPTVRSHAILGRAAPRRPCVAELRHARHCCALPNQAALCFAGRALRGHAVRDRDLNRQANSAGHALPSAAILRSDLPRRTTQYVAGRASPEATEQNQTNRAYLSRAGPLNSLAQSAARLRFESYRIKSTPRAGTAMQPEPSPWHFRKSPLNCDIYRSKLQDRLALFS